MMYACGDVEYECARSDIDVVLNMSTNDLSEGLVCPCGGKFAALSNGSATYTRGGVVTYPFGNIYRYIISIGCSETQLQLQTVAENYTIEMSCTGWYQSCLPDNTINQTCDCPSGEYSNLGVCHTVTNCSEPEVLEGPTWNRICSTTDLSSLPVESTAATTTQTTVPSTTNCQEIEIFTSDVRDNHSKDCLQLTSVEFASTVVRVGDYAFSGCVALTQAKFSSNVNVIGVGAFQHTAITALVLPAPYVQLGAFAFANTTALVSVQGVFSELGDYSFFGATNLTTFPILTNTTCGSTILPSHITPTFSNCSVETDTFDGESIIITLELLGELEVRGVVTLMDIQSTIDLIGHATIEYDSDVLYGVGNLTIDGLDVIRPGSRLTVGLLSGWAFDGVLNLTNVDLFDPYSLKGSQIHTVLFGQVVHFSIGVFDDTKIENMLISNCSTMDGTFTVCYGLQLPGINRAVNITNCTDYKSTDESCSTCQTGYYRSGTTCKQCDGTCPAGTYVAELCKGEVNIKCASCSPTTWIQDYAHRLTTCQPRTCKNNPHPYPCQRTRREFTIRMGVFCGVCICAVAISIVVFIQADRRKRNIVPRPKKMTQS